MKTRLSLWSHIKTFLLGNTGKRGSRNRRRAKLLRNYNEVMSARGNQRRLDSHREACLAAYQHKAELISKGKGHHTTLGTTKA